MLNYYLDFLSHYPLGEDEKNALEAAGKKLLPAYEKELKALIDEYFKNGFEIGAITDGRKELASASGIEFYTVNFILLVCASEKIREAYIEKGYGEQLFYDSFEDLFYKVRECKAVHGIYGIFVESWYNGFFKLRIFKLGRLEYELKSYDGNKYICDGLEIDEGMPVLGIHIPSSGPLTLESRMDSYRKAYDFFSDRVKDGKIVFVCNSWLLYETNKEIFPAGSNMVSFISDWDIVYSQPTEKFNDSWRVFNRGYDGDTSVLPADTSLRRAIIAWLNEGKPMGYGKGIIVFNGDKILN